MKALLVVLLLAFASCQFPEELLEVASCAFKSEKLRENIPKVIEAFKTKDFEKILSTVFTAFPEVKQDIEKCLDENAEPVLKSSCKNYSKYDLCCKNCGFWGKAKCKMECFNRFCD